MFNQTQAFKQYLTRRDEVINSSNSQEINTGLFNDKTFYHAFTEDLLRSKKEVIIYSPYVTKFRANCLRPTIEKLRNRNIEVFVFTRPIADYEPIYQPQIECALKRYEELGVSVFFLSGSIHEKVAIIDREILWEGSLNILSQRASREMMRRTPDKKSATEVMAYLGLNQKMAESYKLKYEKLYQSLIKNSVWDNKTKIRFFLFGFLIALMVLWIFLAFGGMISLFRSLEPISKLLISK